MRLFTIGGFLCSVGYVGIFCRDFFMLLASTAEGSDFCTTCIVLGKDVGFIWRWIGLWEANEGGPALLWARKNLDYGKPKLLICVIINLLVRNNLFIER